MDKHCEQYLKHCVARKTTEAGDDEIYMPVGLVTFSSGRSSFVAPGSDSHWDMNDSGDKQERNVNWAWSLSNLTAMLGLTC